MKPIAPASRAAATVAASSVPEKTTTGGQGSTASRNASSSDLTPDAGQRQIEH
jgi:hypothetical protein